MIPTFLETHWGLIKQIRTVGIFSACSYHNNLSRFRKCGSNFHMDLIHVPKESALLLSNVKQFVYKRWLTSEHLQAFKWFQSTKKTKKKQKNWTTALQSLPLLASSPQVIECPNNCRDTVFWWRTAVQVPTWRKTFNFNSSHHKFNCRTLSTPLASPLFLCISLTSPSLSCAGRLCWRQRVLPSWRRRWRSMGRLRGWSARTECAAGDAPIPVTQKQQRRG